MSLDVVAGTDYTYQVIIDTINSTTLQPVRTHALLNVDSRGSISSPYPITGVSSAALALGERRTDGSLLALFDTPSSTTFSFVSGSLVPKTMPGSLVVATLGASGSVSPLYSLTLPLGPADAQGARSSNEVDLAASRTSGDFAVVHSAATSGGGLSRVLDIVGSDNHLRRTVLIDGDASDDRSDAVTALADGRYLVSWRETHFTGGVDRYGGRLFDEVNLKAVVVSGDGAIQGSILTLASASGQAGASFGLLYEIDARPGSGFLLNAEVIRSNSTITNTHQTLAVWDVPVTGGAALVRTVATNDFAITQNLDGRAVGTISLGELDELGSGRLLYKLDLRDVATGKNVTTGRLYDADGNAVSATFEMASYTTTSTSQEVGTAVTPLKGDVVVFEHRTVTSGANGMALRTGLQTYDLGGIDFSNHFGFVTHDAHSPGGQVYALYDGLLGRAPDVLGLEFWADAFSDGVAPKALAAGFLASAEGQARAGAADDATFVTQLYNATLHRNPDGPGLSYWTDALAHGTSRAEVGVGFALSSEHLANIQPALDAGLFVPDADASAVARIYYTMLSRAPDAAGLKFWTDAIKAGTPLTAETQSFLDSPEAQAKVAGLTTAQYVDLVYTNALGRHAEPEGLAFWSNGIDGHAASRVDVTTAIGQSPEAQAHLAPLIEQGWHLA